MQSEFASRDIVQVPLKCGLYNRKGDLAPRNLGSVEELDFHAFRSDPESLRKESTHKREIHLTDMREAQD